MANNQPTPKSNLQLLFYALGAIGFLLILGGFAFAVYNAGFNAAANVIIGIGVLFFLLLFIKAEIANLKYYLHVFVYSALVFGICVVGYLFSRQYTVQKDLTKEGLYSLSPASLSYLKGLDKEVTINVIASDAAPFRDVQSLYSPAGSKLKWRFLDPRKDRAEILRLGDVVRPMDVFITSGPDNQSKKKMSATEIMGLNSESAITNAIIEVTRDTKPKLYFLTGHGEVAFEQPARSRNRQQQESAEPSLAGFRKFLTDRGMDTVRLDLAQTSAVPDDASLLVIAGPANDLLAPEVSAIDTYLKKGGKALVLVDVPQRDFNKPLANLAGLLGKYGVASPDKVIIDLDAAQLTGKAILPMVAWFNPEQAITKSLGETRILLSITRPVEAGPNPPTGLTVTDLLKTGDRAFSADLASVVQNEKIAPPPQGEWKAQTVALAVSKPAPPQMPGMNRQPKDDSAAGTKLVVFGSSSFIQDELLASQQPAVRVMLNAVNWLTEQSDKIDVAPRQIEGTPIVLTDGQIRVIFAVAVLLIPAVLFFGGISYSLMRRNK